MMRAEWREARHTGARGTGGGRPKHSRLSDDLGAPAWVYRANTHVVPIAQTMSSRLPGPVRRAVARVSAGALVLVALFLLAGCAVLEPEPRAGERRELQRARALWQRQALASYRFEYTPRCAQCAPNATRAVLVSVDRGVVIDAEYVGSYEPVNTNPQAFGTVDSLFAIVQRAYDQHAYTVRVRYDETRGFPSDVWIDWRGDLADEESGFAVPALSPWAPVVTEGVRAR